MKRIKSIGQKSSLRSNYYRIDTHKVFPLIKKITPSMEKENPCNRYKIVDKNGGDYIKCLHDQ